MQTYSAEIGIWPGVVYLVGMVALIAVLWRCDMRRLRRIRREQAAKGRTDAAAPELLAQRRAGAAMKTVLLAIGAVMIGAAVALAPLVAFVWSPE